MKAWVQVLVLLGAAQSAGWAETRFQVPDTRLIFEMSGLAADLERSPLNVYGCAWLQRTFLAAKWKLVVTSRPMNVASGWSFNE